MTRHVEVLPYHIEWPAQFEAEAEALKRIFGSQVVTVHHFGSTSIPGSSAKPVIDILITVRDIQCADSLVQQLRQIGYIAVGEYGIPGRRFFYKGTEDNRTHHLHVYQHDNPNILRHIAFRDYLRTHPVPARQYSRLKEELACAFPEDMDSYIAGKNDFVKQHEREALAWWNECSREVESD
jgi:GrpB-like predicted nucleotidyltransferase (UPF0157 family)